MPIREAPHVRRPYVPPVYESDGMIRLADLGREGGRARAAAALRGGEIAANAWNQAGGVVLQSLRDLQARREAEPFRQAELRRIAFDDRQRARVDTAHDAGVAKTEADRRTAARLQELLRGNGGQRIPNDVLLQEFGPEDAAHINKVFDELFPKPAEPYTLNPGDKRFGADNQPVAENPKPVDALAVKFTQPLRLADGSYAQFQEGKIPAGTKFWQEPSSATTERPSLWVTKDGEQRYVSPSEAARLSREGWRSGQGREQGRPVTSGDANRIADFDTSLDDLAVLGSALEASGSTGTTAKIGASVPNWVTEYTGWGSDAKKKQALIDRVKQVIGKALEGGVLRKEDEVKYEKILPTVGDPNALVLSKLEGLGDAIKLRRSRLIESLGDAGFETSKYGDYTPPLDTGGGVTAVPDLTGLPAGRGRKFTSGPFAGQTWSKDASGKAYKVDG